MEYIEFKVCIHCFTYNHAPFILEALNGFTMQQTSFPFMCAIVDDASNDGEQDIIMHYLESDFDLESFSPLQHEETEDYKHIFARHRENKNCYFSVFLLKYNHYQAKKPKGIYLSDLTTHALYTALCEGDDYWISPDKLQKQVDFLDSHPDFTMVCNRTKLYSVRQKRYIGENCCYEKSQVVDVKDVINKAGLFISTCSIMYRNTVKENYPEYCIKCKVGDYPLQIMCAMKGKVFYLDNMMSVYRVQNPMSWMGRQQWKKMDKGRVEVIKSRVEMLKGFQKDFPEYERVLRAKIGDEINRNIPGYNLPANDAKEFVSCFSDEVRRYSLRWKIDLWIRKCRIPKIRRLYQKLFMKRFYIRKKLYAVK